MGRHVITIIMLNLMCRGNIRKGGSDSPASVSSMWIMKIERELRLPPLSPAEREVAHPFFFSRANTLPSPSCPSR